jgi:hypothetical protein
MPDEKEFPTGLFVNPPRSTAPDFVKGRISIRVIDFLEYLSEKNSEWLRIDIKESFKVDEETGLKKWYAQVDTWVKPGPKKEGGDGLPF